MQEFPEEEIFYKFNNIIYGSFSFEASGQSRNMDENKFITSSFVVEWTEESQNYCVALALALISGNLTKSDVKSSQWFPALAIERDEFSSIRMCDTFEHM